MASAINVPPEARVVFGQSLEGIIRGFGSRLTPQVQAQLAKIGIDCSKPFLVAYPLATYLRAMDLMVTIGWPGLPRDRAFHEFGRAFMDGYGTTFMGKALLASIRLLGPKRTLGRMTQSFRTATNYVESEHHELGPGRYEFKVWPVVNPCWYSGIVHAGLEFAGARECVVEVTQIDDDRVSYRATWKP